MMNDFPTDYPIQSMSQAKRFIRQGAVEVNGKKETNASRIIKTGDKIKVGKRWFLDAVEKPDSI